MNDTISNALRVWVKSAVESTLEEALGQAAPSPAIPDMLSHQILSEINTINTKVGKLMATLADIQSIPSPEDGPTATSNTLVAHN